MDKPVAWMLKTGHGTYFQETISEEMKALEFGGKKMWVPLYRQADEPIAYVSGTYGGRVTITALNPALVLPDNMALYAKGDYT